tara:strand:- start:502 stop:1098 length:597 start_codon:yes stop_codon:yes gene_type:complete
MANEHTLKRILDQIAEHKVELDKVDPNDLGSEEAREEPIEKVEEIFSEANIQKRAQEAAPVEPSLSEEDSNPLEETEQVSYPSHTPLEDLPSDVREELSAKKETYEFRSVFDFKDFILTFYERFNDIQKAALNSIVTVCDTIEVGCKCKKGSRLKIAEDYYVQFITKNQATGIIEEFKKILNSEKIKFYSKDKLFLEE